jgi:antitoxin HicB
MASLPATETRDGHVFLSHVTVPDIPEVVTEGDSMEEATEYAIELILGEYIRRRAGIPRPSKRKGKHMMQASGIRKAELARRLGVSKPQVERLLDLAHGSRLEQIKQAFRALKKRLELSVQDAA